MFIHKFVGFEFKFETVDAIDGNSMNQPYDYLSIMHYPPFALTNEPNTKTIVPKRKIDGQIPEIGQRIGISSGDITATNLLYNCPSVYFYYFMSV